MDDSFDVNAIPAYEPEGDGKILTYVHPEVFAQGDHIYRLKQDETLSSYAFLNRDGTKTVYYLDEAVKFTAADGSIREKDLTLTAAMKGYQTAENDIGLHISENPAAGIRIAYNNKQITLLPNGGSGAGQLSGNTVRYEGYYGEDTALVYTPTLNGVKEEIILSSYTGQNEFVFYINTGGLYLYQTGDRYYLAEGKGSTYRIWLGQIEVFDRNLKPCKGEMTAETILAGQRYKLTVSVSEAYLTDPDTAYPVTVDPTLTVSDAQTGANAIQDAPIYEGYPTSNFGSYQYNRAGYAGTAYKKGRTAVKLSGLLSDSGYMNAVAGEITSAQFYMADASGTSNAYVKVYALSSNSTWTENTVTWNNAGTTASTPYANIAPPAGGFGCFDITDLVKAWKNGSYSSGQCGFLLRGNNEVSTDKVLYSCEHSTSAMRPYVTVTYSTGSRTVNITNTVISVNENSTKALTATTSPSGLTVTWTSSNPSVATVSSSGVVSGIKAGTATITASVDGGATDACTVYVVKPGRVYYIRNSTSVNFMDGGGANIAPENLTNIRQKELLTSGNDRLAQLWKVTYVGGEKYSVRPMHKQNLALSVIGSNDDVSLQDIGTTDTASGVPNSAKWRIFYNQTGYVFECNGNTSRTLYPSGGSAAVNKEMVVSTYSSSNTAFRWYMNPENDITEQILIYDKKTGDCVTTPTVHVKPQETRSLSDAGIEVEFVTLSTNRQLQFDSPQPSKVTVNSTTGAITGVTSMSTVVVTVSGRNSTAAPGTFEVQCSPYRINLDVKYDEGYRDREASRGEYSSASERISTYLSSLYDYYLEEFGLYISYSTPSCFTSLADECPAGRDNLCSCGTCVETDLEYPEETLSGMHHKNMNNVLYNLDVDPANTYSMVFIGHPLCEKDSGNTCEETVAYGITVYALNTSAIFTYDDTAFEHMTVFHEFGHLVGTEDHYDLPAHTTTWYQDNYPDAGFSMTCIYSENTRLKINDYESILRTRIMCDGCKSFVRAHLEENF